LATPESLQGGSARSRAVSAALIYPPLILFALIGAGPFLWALATSVKTPVDAFAMPPVFFFRPTFDAYLQLLQDGQFAD
jgi:multiple sugar transport system permease protein